MNLQMRSETQGNTLVISLEGELTLTQSPALRTWITEQLENGPGNVDVNCRQLSYVDSTGLGALIFLRKAVLDQSGSLRLIQVSGWLRKFLQVTGLEEAFNTGESKPQHEPQT